MPKSCLEKPDHEKGFCPERISQRGPALCYCRSRAVFASAQLRNSWVTIARNFGPILGEGYAWAMTTGS
jgi:hypothetical protein